MFSHSYLDICMGCVIIFVISIGYGVVFSLSFLPPPQFSGNKVVSCTWIYVEDSDCILSR